MLMNAIPILKEILQALKDLYEKGEEHIIYINKLPITPEDRELLLDVLREGQVKITYFSKTQPAEWKETGIYGVWIGVIKNRDNKPVLETIEITFFPKLASAQREDVAESIKYLEEKIKEIEERASRQEV
ncbi:MAG TPA: hydrogenase expression/formation protein [Aquifex aeolicus]|nr:hydrogenase expression/formation protein [Aquifex aeolicus]